MADPAVTVVIPTYQRPALLDRCLRSLVAQDIGAAAFEVCVVDDHSDPSTEVLLQDSSERMPNLRWARQPVNRGPAAARNRAVALGSAPVLLFLDDDIEAAPDLVRTHVELHRTGGDHTGFVGRVDWAPDLERTAFMRWLDTTELQFAFDTWMRPGPLPSPESAFYTCNLSVRRNLFEAVGGFDERFPHPAYEDVELGHRLGGRGLTLVYAPEAHAFHTRAIDLPTFRRRMAFVAESAVLLQRTHPEVPVTVPDLADGPRAQLMRLVSGALARIRPTFGGRDVRARHYWAEIEHAMARGVRQARRTDHGPG